MRIDATYYYSMGSVSMIMNDGCVWNIIIWRVRLLYYCCTYCSELFSERENRFMVWVGQCSRQVPIIMIIIWIATQREQTYAMHACNWNNANGERQKKTSATQWWHGSGWRILQHNSLQMRSTHIATHCAWHKRTYLLHPYSHISCNRYIKSLTCGMSNEMATKFPYSENEFRTFDRLMCRVYGRVAASDQSAHTHTSHQQCMHQVYINIILLHELNNILTPLLMLNAKWVMS